LSAAKQPQILTAKDQVIVHLVLLDR